MKKREEGYVFDTSYPIHLQKEIQPIWLNHSATFLGLKSIDITREFTYCELGCATGLNLIFSALNNPTGYFIGVDFNEKHIKEAKKIVELIGIKNIEFIQSDFKSFSQRENIAFDFIVCHGTWSWISPIHQRSILEIVAKSLKEKGIFYLHYMCHPGSTSLLSVQKLLNVVDHHLNGSSKDNIKVGIDLFNQLNNAGTFIDYPNLDSIEKVFQQNDLDYLAHEFLTDFWNPQYSIDVHQFVAQTKASYIGSANLFDNLENISIPQNSQKVLKNISSPILKEYIKDLARNQKQRIDLFQKNPQLLTKEEHLKALNSMIFTLVDKNILTKEIKLSTPIGEIEIPKEITKAILEELSKKDCSFEELGKLKIFSNQIYLLFESIQMLMWNDTIFPKSKNYEFIDKKNFIKLKNHFPIIFRNYNYLNC